MLLGRFDESGSEVVALGNKDHLHVFNDVFCEKGVANNTPSGS